MPDHCIQCGQMTPVLVRARVSVAGKGKVGWLCRECLDYWRAIGERRPCPRTEWSGATGRAKRNAEDLGS